MPKVLNKKRGVLPADAVYVGRPTKFGNPFSMRSESERDLVCDKYERFVLSNKSLLLAIKAELKGRDLVCWCAPLRCHAETLIRIANTPDNNPNPQSI